MQTISTAFERELLKLIDERRKSLTENVVSGVAIQSLERYREHVGRISELDEVVRMMDEANTTLSKQR
jgi:hypothetical protein